MDALLTAKEDLLKTLGDRMRAVVAAHDLKRLKHAQDMLAKLQEMSTLDRIMRHQRFLSKYGKKRYPHHDKRMLYESVDSIIMETIPEELEELAEEEEEGGASVREEETSSDIYIDFVERDDIDCKWRSHFPKFTMVSHYDDFSLCDERKIVQIFIDGCGDEVEYFLHKGVRCFLIDLSIGSSKQNMASIVTLRERELKVSKEIGYPVRTTLVACLSPRLQYTGQMLSIHEGVELMPGELLTLTVDRGWCVCGSKNSVYVNAFFLFEELRKCDVIFIGDELQVAVKSLTTDFVECTVVTAGKLYSRTPVLFPAHCDKFRISMEELEDISFCKEVGINLVLSFTQGSIRYHQELMECLQFLECDNMQLGTRLQINDPKFCADDLDWILDSYEAFLFEIKPRSPNITEKEPQVLKLCEATSKLLTTLYACNKPIIFNPEQIAKQNYVVHEDDVALFHYPDRYLMKCSSLVSTHYFFILQESFFKRTQLRELNIYPMCDVSLTGSDTLARACVTASIEMNAKVILVVTSTGLMARKIAHFRPTVPIILITSLQNAPDYLGIFWNITVLYLNLTEKETHGCRLFRHFLFGMLYARTRKLIMPNDEVIFVYNKKMGTKFCDMYQVFKYNAKGFVFHLKALFLDSEQ